MSRLTITNRARVRRPDGRRLRSSIVRILAEVGLEGTLSVVLVDDPEIHDLNRRFLEHDYATDVIAFPFDEPTDGLVGEVVVSAETAAREARARDLSFDRELLMYVTHGILHLAGMEDHTASGRRGMDREANRILDALGV